MVPPPGTRPGVNVVPRVVATQEGTADETPQDGRVGCPPVRVRVQVRAPVDGPLATRRDPRKPVRDVVRDTSLPVSVL